MFLEILFLRYTGGDLHGGAGEGVREIDIAVYMVGRFPEVSGEGLYPVGCVLQFGQVEHVIVLRLCQLQVVARAVRTVFEELDVHHGVCAVAGCLACRLFDALQQVLGNLFSARFYIEGGKVAEGCSGKTFVCLFVGKVEGGGIQPDGTFQIFLAVG